MSECYECGRYIERGEGFRRTVETGSSTWVHIGRYSGSSYGTRSGRRTVCFICAAIIDQMRKWAWLRTICCIIALFYSVKWGFQHVGQARDSWVMGLLGFSCIIGLPVVIGSYAWEIIRYELIRRKVLRKVEEAYELYPEE